jgi:hypothetical protein
MSFAVPQVFISSTSEFAAERKQLEQALGSLNDFDFKPYIYEADAAGPQSPESRLRAVLDDSEIVVLILGSNYGSAFPGRPISIVEWEYEYARETQKELKGYVRQTPPVDPRQAEFVARVREFRGGTWCRLFADASQLLSYVVTDVKRWRLDSWKYFRDTAVERRRWKDRVILGTGAFVALATVLGTIGGVFAGVPMEKLALILGSGIAMLVGLGWLLKSDVF